MNRNIKLNDSLGINIIDRTAQTEKVKCRVDYSECECRQKRSDELGLIQLRAFKGRQQDTQHFRRRAVCLSSLWAEE